MIRNKIIILVVLLLALLGMWAISDKTPRTPSAPISNAQDVQIRGFVTEFGKRLKDVSLLAPTAARKAVMDTVYKDYVAPELLEKWYPEGAEALGRHTSSPWPDRINILEVRPSGEGYVVEGNVIEVTNVDGSTKTQVAAVYPVTLTLEKRDGKWLVVKVEKGAYSEIPQRRTIVGIWECLPPKDPLAPHTLECAFGIAVDQSDGHYAVDTSLMSKVPVDFPTGAKVRVTGVVTPATHLSSVQKYDIDGIISATTIEKI